jgi:glycosyltransferase involved in cell wall biosynthesis
LFNKQATIGNTLKSVLQQDFIDFEVIIINDGSTDESEKEVSQIKDDRIKYFKITNKGVSSARNFGIANATADYIAFLDADDFWYNNHLTDLFQLTNSFPNCGIFAANYEIVVNQNKTVQTKFPLNVNKNWSGIVEDFFGASFQNRIALTSAVAVRKSIFESIENFDISLNFGEDLDLWIRIALKYEVCFCNTISVRYFTNTVNRLSDKSVFERNFAKLNQFKMEEKCNLNLKKFLDIYRTEFAIKHKLAGKLTEFRFYNDQLNGTDLNWKTKFILKLPRWTLRFFIGLKKKLEENNILISIYN